MAIVFQYRELMLHMKSKQKARECRARYSGISYTAAHPLFQFGL